MSKLDKQIDEDVLWCGYHGLTCTGCGQAQVISVEALKAKTYTGSQYYSPETSPYENYLKMKEQTND